MQHAILLTDGQNGETGRVFTRRCEPIVGHVHLRLPRRRHRLAGRRAARDRLGAAGHASTSSPIPPTWPPTSRDDDRARWARPWRTSRCGSGRRATARCGSSSRSRRRWRTSPAAAPRSEPARRLPARLVGRGEPRLPRLRRRRGGRRAATRCWPRASRGAIAGRRGARPAAGRGEWTDDAALSTRINRSVAALHRAGRAGRGDPGGPRRAQGRRRARRPRRGSAGPRSSPTSSGNDGTARLLADGRRRRGRGDRHGAAAPRSSEADEMALDTRSTRPCGCGG